ncbi:MAG: DUF3108 domain-containing protein [Hyphomonadaceae bacterium]|nr:MAG: hypothetical protein FD160_1325 [Caulobacteraceae bacterium]MBT9446243.1 DUF3108 domain-containing protein [Hyphomonadaceae bacterium]TPW07181.1 MAG: hypothetical protein FD124_1326 [Alphaproteobacteria bacterium]
MLTRLRPLATAAAVLVLWAAPAHADRFALEYDGNLFGIAPLGGVTFDISTGPEDYDVKATLRTGGLLRLFERTDIVARTEGRIENGSVRWERYDLDHTYSGKRRVTAMQRSHDGLFSAQITPIYRDWGSPPATDEDRRTARDPLSSLAAMSVDVARTRRCEGAYATFDGLTRYDLVLSGGEVRRFDGGGYEGPALRCRMRYVQLRGFNPVNENQRRRQPEGEIWFALAENSNVAPPVRTVIPTPFGRAGIHLRKWRRASVDVETSPTPAP